MHEAVDRDRGLAALGDRARNVVRTGRSAAGKDIGLAGLAGHGVGADKAVGVQAHAGSGGEGVRRRDVALGGKDRVCGELLGLVAVQAADGHRAVADLLYCERRAERDAFLLGLGDVRLDRSGDDGHACCAALARGARTVNGLFPAAEHDDAALDGVSLPVQVSARVHGAGRCVLALLPSTDAEEERLVALGAQRVERRVLADFHAGAELHAHAREHVDLGGIGRAVEAEGRDERRRSAAEHRVLFQHGHGVALLPEKIGTAQSGGAGADDGDLFRMGDAGRVFHRRQNDLAGVQLAPDERPAHVGNGDGGVDLVAGADLFALAAAHAAAQLRERRGLPDERRGVVVSADGQQLQAALHRDVQRAHGLARRGAAGHDVRAVRAEVRVIGPAVVGHAAVGVIGIGNVRIGRAALLAELERVGLAAFDALAAGDALFLVHAGDVVRADGARRAEQFLDAQREARAAAAVADGGRVLKARGLVDLVHETVVLGTAEDLVCFFLRDEPVIALLGIADGVVVEVHAHVLFKMAAALAHEAAGPSARARADADGRRVLDERLELIIRRRARVVLDRAHDRHDAHRAHADRAVVEHRREHLEPAAGVRLKALAEHGVAVALLAVGKDALHDARHPDRVEVAALAVHIAVADCAGLAQLVELLLRVFHALLCTLGHVLHGAVGLQAQVHHDRTHLIVDDRLEDLVLGIVVRDAGVRHALKTDLRGQLENIRSFCHAFSSFNNG